jgi:hypothetical protein
MRRLVNLLALPLLVVTLAIIGIRKLKRWRAGK